MRNYEIVSDSSCDLDVNFISEIGLNIVPFSVSFDDVTYLRENIDINIDEFYARLEASTSVKTSLPSIQVYIDAFKPIVEKGSDVLCVCLSSKFSGSYQSAVNAAEMLMEDFPESKINIIDSKTATGLGGHIVLKALDFKKAGLTLEENTDKIIKMTKTTQIYFTVDTLDYLTRGGRIGKGAALAGTLLDIKPILFVKDGEIGPHSKVRRRKKAIAQLIDIAFEEASKIERDFEFVLIASLMNEEAETFFEEVENRFGRKAFGRHRIGVTIGVHTGPTALGVGIVELV